MKSTHTTKNTILWAHDDTDDLDFFNDILPELATNHNVIEFANRHLLLTFIQRLAKEQYPCLIVLDMSMPVLDGRETFSIIRTNEELKNIPVVVFTTSNSSLDMSFCEKYQTEMFSKPVCVSIWSTERCTELGLLLKVKRTQQLAKKFRVRPQTISGGSINNEVQASITVCLMNVLRYDLL